MADGGQITELPPLPMPVEQMPDIVKRYVAGESIQTIAADQRVSRRTIYRWMLSSMGDAGYYDLVTHCLVARVADADHELDSASDPCHIARARETARFARMDLERRRPSLYGQKQEVHHTFSISDELQQIAERRALEAAQHDVQDAEIISEAEPK